MWVHRKIVEEFSVGVGQSQRNCSLMKWAVGFYDPNKEWHEESRHASRDEAAARVHWLNGGNT